MGLNKELRSIGNEWWRVFFLIDEKVKGVGPLHLHAILFGGLLHPTNDHS